MKKILAFIIIAILGYNLYVVFSEYQFGAGVGPVGKEYLEKTVEKTGAVNVVTAIVVNYRGFDTLGEVSVLFLAATGLGAILFGMRDDRNKEDEPKSASLIVQTGSKMLYPLVLIMGAYVVVHGHLTPGGGFQGGAIVATGVLLMFLAYRSFHVNHSVISFVESLAGLTFVTVGLFGLIYGSSFLENFLSIGEANKLLSAGVIPIIYIAVGFKVGAELTGLVDNLIATTKADDPHGENH